MIRDTPPQRVNIALRSPMLQLIREVSTSCLSARYYKERKYAESYNE